MILDGAEVIVISKKGDFGVIKYADDSMKPILVKYLAICKYENDKNIFLFLCNDKIEVEQDSIFDTVDDAKNYAKDRNKHVVWEDGITYIDFNDVDFQGGKVNKIEGFGEDMLEVQYPNGYMIDVGFLESKRSFIVTIIKENDWINIVKEIEAKTDIELKRKLAEAIHWTKVQ